MKVVLDFYVVGLPIAQPRTKSTFSHGKIIHYTPDNGALAWKQSIMTAAMQEKNLTDSTFPLQGAVFLGCSFYMPRPKSHFKKTGALKESSPDWHTNKPDSDNLLKAVKDALTNCQIWRDDAQVAKVRVAKSYVNLKDCSPGVQITIGALP